jgi:quinoprotein relay system zinc metallohydrolase 2
MYERSDCISALGRCISEVSGTRAAAMLFAAGLRAGAFLLPGAGLAHTAEAAATGCTAQAEITEIAPGAFVRQGATALPDPVNRGAIANIGFIVGAKSVAVIDTGGSLCDGMALREAIRARTALPVKLVINTHVHPDHIFGNAAFTGPGVTILGHRNLPRALAERGDHYLRSYGEQVGSAAMGGTNIVPPTQLIDGRLDINLGERVLLIEAQPAAHTDNDLTVFDRTSGTLWTGDLVFIDHIPVLDGSLKGWLSVTETLMRHDARRIVPGHGAAPAPWPAAGENQLRYLRRLASDLRLAIGAAKGIREAAGAAGTSESGNWRLFDSFNGRNATTGFAELEWD